MEQLIFNQGSTGSDTTVGTMLDDTQISYTKMHDESHKRIERMS